MTNIGSDVQFGECTGQRRCGESARTNVLHPEWHDGNVRPTLEEIQVETGWDLTADRCRIDRPMHEQKVTPAHPHDPRSSPSDHRNTVAMRIALDERRRRMGLASAACRVKDDHYRTASAAMPAPTASDRCDRPADAAEWHRRCHEISASAGRPTDATDRPMRPNGIADVVRSPWGPGIRARENLSPRGPRARPDRRRRSARSRSRRQPSPPCTRRSRRRHSRPRDPLASRDEGRS